MAKQSDFLEPVMVDAPGCLIDVALYEIRNTLIDFCEKTLILQINADPIGTIAGVNAYDIEVDSGYVPVKIMALWHNTNKLSPVSPDNLDAAATFNPSIKAASTPTTYTQFDAKQVILIPTPSLTEKRVVAMRVAVKPSRSSLLIDDQISEHYFEGIVAGAKSRLQLQPGKSYTNPQAAVVNNSIYSAAINVARQRAVHGYTRSSLSARMRRI